MTQGRRGGLSAVNPENTQVEVSLDPGWNIAAWTDNRGRLKIAAHNTEGEEVIALTRISPGKSGKVQAITLTTQQIEYKQLEN